MSNLNITVNDTNNTKSDEEVNKKIEEWFNQLESDENELEMLTTQNNKYIKASESDYARYYGTTDYSKFAMQNISRLISENKNKNKNKAIELNNQPKKSLNKTPFSMKLF